MYKYYYCNHTDKIHRTKTKHVGFALNPNNGHKVFYVKPYEPFSKQAIERTIPCNEHYKPNIPYCLVPVEQYQHDLQAEINDYRWKSNLKRTLKTRELQQIPVQNNISNHTKVFSQIPLSTEVQNNIANGIQLSNQPNSLNQTILSSQILTPSSLTQQTVQTQQTSQIQLSNNVSSPYQLQFSNNDTYSDPSQQVSPPPLSNQMEVDKEEKTNLYKKIRFAHDKTNNDVFGGLAAMPCMNNSSSAWIEVASQTLCPIQNCQSKRNKEKAKLKVKTKYYQNDNDDNVYKYIIIHNKVKLPKIREFAKKK
eukprot:254162_1